VIGYIQIYGIDLNKVVTGFCQWGAWVAWRGLTHPVIATLDHPLSAFGAKRVSGIKFFWVL